MKKILLLPLVVSSVAWLSACSQEPAATTPTEQNNFDAVYNSITADKIAPPLKTLASDEFEGRLPTTAGEKKTLDFLLQHGKLIIKIALIKDTGFMETIVNGGLNL